ncbi:transposase, partial [Paenibacillus ferrarius]|uniref:transposase n=1 Tax=Paenibacillus ferrarius TaxID=1469647 RepID=UPI003D26921D
GAAYVTIHVRYKNFDQLSFADLLVYSKLPVHPFWSHIESKIDFSFADTLCAVLYTGKGQRPYAPSLKLKIHLIQSYYALSDRLVEERIISDLFIKRFLQLPVDFFGFDHSTIGLDRSRMGEVMFRACHLYILAQMYSHGLWGEQNEQWIIDSFPTNIHMGRRGAYRLIQHAMVRLVQHLRKQAPKSVRKAAESLPLDALGVRLSSAASSATSMLAYSKLVAQAYGLLQWFNHETIKPLLAEWKSRARSEELQATLLRILEENSRPIGPDDGTRADLPDDVQFEKTPRDERPKNRVESAVDPQARTVVKRSKATIGYKTQNLCTTEGVILEVRTVPATEHDQDATADMVATIQHFFGQTPAALLGDSAYGHGRHRMLLAEQGIHVVAPVQQSPNPTGLFPSSLFSYDANEDVFICPKGERSVRRNRSAKLEGTQYRFNKKICFACPLSTQCTTSESGRSVFRSDYVDLYEEAQAYNESLAGQADLRTRYVVERKNNELKNDCGLGLTQTHSRTSLQLKALCAAMVVNLKHTVRKLVNPKPGFLRHVRAAHG